MTKNDPTISNRNAYFAGYRQRRKETTKRLSLELTLDEYAEVKTAAERVGESVAAYIRRAIHTMIGDETG